MLLVQAPPAQPYAKDCAGQRSPEVVGALFKTCND